MRVVGRLRRGVRRVRRQRLGPIVVVGKIDNIEVIGIMGSLCHNSYTGESCCDITVQTRDNTAINPSYNVFRRGNRRWC
jgi:hypothetical protein